MLDKKKPKTNNTRTHTKISMTCITCISNKIKMNMVQINKFLINYLLHFASHVIGVPWGEMGENSGSINSLPPKCVVLSTKSEVLSIEEI